MTHNKLRAMQEIIVAEMEAKRAELQANVPPRQKMRFLCDTRDLEEHISCLGEIDRIDIPPIPPMPVIPVLQTVSSNSRDKFNRNLLQ